MTIPPQAKTWAFVPEGTDFPIQNLPIGRIRTQDGTALVVRVGDHLINVPAVAASGFLEGRPEWYSDMHTALERLGPDAFRTIRKSAFDVLTETNPSVRDNPALRDHMLLPLEGQEIMLPMDVRAFIDFYSGIYHASNVGKMFRPDMAPLLPNYRHLPVGYNGRASSVVVSGTPIPRPSGQTKNADEPGPKFGPTQELDFELEMGFYTSRATQMGEPAPIERCEESMLGFVLVNDWSARDVQRWEYQPLGPFLAKSFATSISPWIVSPDALEPFRIKGAVQEPEVLEHLALKKPAHYNIELEVTLQTAKMTKPQIITHSNARDLYWSFVQQLAHQTSNGTPIEPGDLYASGTISGAETGTYGSLLELTWKGTQPITMEETGETRTFLEDGDTLTMRGWCEGEGYRIGFGQCSGAVLPARVPTAV